MTELVAEAIFAFVDTQLSGGFAEAVYLVLWNRIARVRSMSHSFITYIDEAGDDGIGKFRRQGEGGQTHWLVLSACVVSVQNDQAMPAWRDEITTPFNRQRSRSVHFADLNHDQAVHACKVIGSKPIGAISVISDKRTLVGRTNEAWFKGKNNLYKYMLRYLLERVSASCKRRHANGCDGDGRSKIVFSRRGGMDYDDFRNYMRHLRSVQSKRGARHAMEWDFIDVEGSTALDHSTRAGLQVSDIIASSFHRAVEPNYYGSYEDRYARELANVVMKAQSGPKINFGVKPMPALDRMQLCAEQRAFFDLWR